MAARRSIAPPAAPSALELGPPVVERAALDSLPSAAAVEFYFLTAAAERAWAAISAPRAPGAGALFWIGGPAGVGKTHFLNYILALEERAGAEAGRRAVIRIDADGRAGADLEQRTLEELSRALGIAGRESALWRRMRGAQALEVALAHARRVGVRALDVAIDLGPGQPGATLDYLAELARVAAAPREPALKVMVAARVAAPGMGACALEVAPADDGELTLAALARARRVLDEGAAAAPYREVDAGGFEPRAIFPFHPLALRALLAAVGRPPTVAALAHLVAAVLNHRAPAADACARPVLAVELLEVAAVEQAVAARLGEDGRAALAIAYHAADGLRERAAAREAVGALMLEALAGARALALRELRARLPQTFRAGGATDGAGGRDALAALLGALAARSAGVIVFDGRAARFERGAAGAAELAAYNAALPLARRFDATLGEAREPGELPAALGRLDDAMRRALEEAHRVAAAVAAGELALGGAPQADECRKALAEFSALAAAGARALLGLAADAARRERARRTLAGWEDLAVAAAAAARMRAMRQYLRATGLGPDLARDGAAAAGGGAGAAALAVECQLLIAAMEAGVMPDARRRFQALEARFEKFKWTYLAAYRAAHERWRGHGARLADELADARAHCVALCRLDSIAALGPPQGAGIAARLEELARRIVRCDEEEPLGPERARCARCGFVLGAEAPQHELREAFDQVRRALGEKLAALSHGAIARLIRLHDRGHRLEGFLKITQAAHTGALVRVLDDNLAVYLAQLLDEVGAEGTAPAPPSATRGAELRNFARRRRGGLPVGPRAARPVKPPERRE